jgi:hypothetical protein
MTENEATEPKTFKIKPEPVGDDDYFTAYANGIGIAHTFFDFQFHFAETRIAVLEDIKSETFATIMMSPQHAKIFLMHLQNNLEMYEAKFGEIKIPDGLLELAKTVEIPLRAEQANIYQESPESKG